MAGSGVAHLRDESDIVLRVENLVVEFPTNGGGRVHAVSDVSFDVRRGETLGLVGESGCDKSTTGRALVMLARRTSGRVVVEGRDLDALRPSELRATRRRMHMIFQDPVSSLNSRRRVQDIVAEGLSISSAPKPWRPQVERALEAVGIDPATVGLRRPGELSGGMCQRVAIARALVLEPTLIICDEPVSALDVSIQAQILNLLEDMKGEYGLTMLFVSHDLAVVKNISDRVAVMYLGKLCEITAADRLYEEPRHPYTRALLSAIPLPEAAQVLTPVGIAGEMPSPLEPPSGCRFRTRCPEAAPRCAVEEPELRAVAPDHFVACHFADGGPRARDETPAGRATPLHIGSVRK